MKLMRLLPILALGIPLADGSATAGPIYSVTPLFPGGGNSSFEDWSDGSGFKDWSYDGDGNIAVNSESGQLVYAFDRPENVYDPVAYSKLKGAPPSSEPVYSVPQDPMRPRYLQRTPIWMSSNGYVGYSEELLGRGRHIHTFFSVYKVNGDDPMSRVWEWGGPDLSGRLSSFTTVPNKLDQLVMSAYGANILLDLDTGNSIGFNAISPLGELFSGEPGTGSWSIGRLVSIDDSGRILAYASKQMKDATQPWHREYSGLVMITPVPEPATIWAFALIAGGLGIRRLKRRAAGRS